MKRDVRKCSVILQLSSVYFTKEASLKNTAAAAWHLENWKNIEVTRGIRVRVWSMRESLIVISNNIIK